MMPRLAVFFLVVITWAAPALGDQPFPDVGLKGTLDEAHRSYLGAPAGEFSVSDINADYVLVEIFSMYCPICQRDAPTVNDFFTAILNSKFAKKVRLIGIGAGNTQFEVDFYRQKFAVQFPLFKDEDYTVHKALNNVGTPAFYLVDLRHGGKVLFFQEGAAKSSDELMDVLAKNVEE